MNSKIHIVPHEGEWAVRMTGSKQPLSVHGTQQAAIESAMDAAQDNELDIVVHRRNGSFRNVISHETIERRLAEQEGGLSARQIVWGSVVIGALTALTVYLLVNPPFDPQKLRRRLSL